MKKFLAVLSVVGMFGAVTVRAADADGATADISELTDGYAVVVTRDVAWKPKQDHVVFQKGQIVPTENAESAVCELKTATKGGRLPAKSELVVDRSEGGDETYVHDKGGSREIAVVFRRGDDLYTLTCRVPAASAAYVSVGAVREAVGSHLVFSPRGLE